MSAATFPYRAVVTWSDEDECFIARAPAIMTLATHGDTEEEAVCELRIAGALMLEVMRETGRPIPEPDDLPSSSPPLVP